MKCRLHVLTPGMLTTVQDLGRLGYEHLGVPPSGAMDPGAMRIANVLVGNRPDQATLEFTVQGGRIEILDAPCTIAFAGDAPLRVSMAGGQITETLAPWQSHRLPAAAMLSIGALARGVRGYLAVSGGVDVPLALGSASTLTRAGLGGWHGRALQRGDVLNVGISRRPIARRRCLPLRETRFFYRAEAIGIILGPQADYFAESEISRFLDSTYRIVPQSDRMGLRLAGPLLSHTKGADIITDPIVAGSIQVPGSGQPLIAMNDRQTTGGYPKIATVITADLPRLAQMRSGQSLRFQVLSTAAAVQKWREYTDWISAQERLIQSDPNFPIFPLLFP